MSKPIKWTEDILKARAWFAAGRTFDFKCEKCGATSLTMADDCAAPLADICPGFTALENAHREFEDNYHKLIGSSEQ
jgi:hypothetical protein